MQAKLQNLHKKLSPLITRELKELAHWVLKALYWCKRNVGQHGPVASHGTILISVETFELKK